MHCISFKECVLYSYILKRKQAERVNQILLLKRSISFSLFSKKILFFFKIYKNKCLSLRETSDINQALISGLLLCFLFLLYSSKTSADIAASTKSFFTVFIFYKLLLWFETTLNCDQNWNCLRIFCFWCTFLVLLSSITSVYFVLLMYFDIHK